MFFWLMVLATGALHPARVQANFCAVDYTAMPGPVWHGGLAEARRILSAAGVEAAWRRCKPGDSGLRIRIYVVTTLPAGSEALGCATPAMRRAYIHGPNIARNAGGAYLKWMMLLGTVIAHEIGHMAGLEHEPGSIMRGGWSPRDLFDVEAGRLRFTEEQAGKVRTWAGRHATVLSWSR